MYDDYSKKYGNLKLAEKKIQQILGSCYYHYDTHPKIQFFSNCLHIGRKKFSTDILLIYLTALDKIFTSNVGVSIKFSDKDDVDIVPFLKAIDGIKIIFEDKIPLEAYARLKGEVERISFNKDRIKVVDLDRMQEILVNYYLRHCGIMLN